MDIQTHEKIDNKLCGSPIELKKDYCEVLLKTGDNMCVDDSGLIHGGFIFGMADYAAMLAVNHPNVVLGSSNVKFLKPVKKGDVAIAKATVLPSEGKKKVVKVSVVCGPIEVLSGELTCFVLDKHVLAD